jgi:hypothetical protein
MHGAAISEQLQTTRSHLDRVCAMLTAPSPEALDQCSALLEVAGRQLTEWQPRLRQSSGDAPAFEEARRLRTSLLRAGRLLEGASSFHNNWMRLRGAISGGYTERGEPALVDHGSRIFLRG